MFVLLRVVSRLLSGNATVWADSASDRSRRSLRLTLTLIAAITFAVLPAAANFTDVTAGSGIDYVQAARGSSDLAVYGGALAAVDVDGDGWVDVVAARSDGGCLLFMNNGDGTFREDGAARGLAGISGIGGIAAGDFTNSGRQDLFMVPLNGYRCFYLVNDGNGNFTEQAQARGADLTTTINPHQGFSVSLVDYDRDGYLDLYFTEWGVASSAENHLHSALLRNRGAAAPGHFENRTQAAGLTQPRKGGTHHGYSAAWADFDGDGWPDLALVSDFGTSQFFWNNGDGTFTERGKESGVALDENGMGVAVGDYDGDGQLDLFVSSIFDRVSYAHSGVITGNKLYRYTGDRRFTETATAAGVDRTGWSWGAAFLDHDNNGTPDLLVTNGITDGLVPDPAVPASNDAENDPTVLFRNDGQGRFADITAGSGITDTGQGRAVVVFDYDNDGDEDVLISQAYGRPILYRNNAAGNGQRWLRLRLQGTASNRGGIGAIVKVSNGGKVQTQVFNPTNSFIGQRGPIMHFGLGAAGATVNSVEVRWPGGTVQTVTGLAVNQSHLIVEAQDTQTAPVITRQPVGGDFAKEDAVTLTVAATGNPAPVFVWEKDGTAIPGATGPTLSLNPLRPVDAGVYAARAINPRGAATSQPAVIRVTADPNRHSVAGWWNRVMLDAIRADLPYPTIHARNLFHVSAAMWDAFWAYDAAGWSRARPVFHRETVDLDALGAGREAARQEAISYAAHRVLTSRYRNSIGHVETLAGFRWLMQQLGYNPDFTGTTGTSPAATGNRIGQAVLDATWNDGANEAGNYVDNSGYTARNQPLDFKLPGTTMAEPNYWQPLLFDRAVTQNGIELGAIVQYFIGSNWRMVRGFALEKPTPSTIALDPGPPPRLGTDSAAEFRRQAVEVIRFSSMLDPADSARINISPGYRLNNTLGANNGNGHTVNPVTGQPYASNFVRRADYGRILAEYWADGPASETPPGHWNVIFNEITADSRLTRRFGGAGPELSRLEWDVCGYLALNGALHDAAIAAWTIKRQYDSARPISMIRHLAGLGQSSDPAQPAYHSGGIPLEPGLIEVITAESAAAGQRHVHLADHIGKIAVRSWRGAPADFLTETGGVGWILAERWMPYQMSTFVSPAFAGYVSGHSAFSRAGAEVLTRLTGSAFFPGGLGERRFGAGAYLIFEYGPAEDTVMQWATYYDAADNAGISRLWGGIHIEADDFAGRKIGADIGRAAFLQAESLRGGDPAPAPRLPGASPSSPVETPAPTTPSNPSPGPSAPTGGGSSSSGGGSGGGAPSVYFLLGLGVLQVLRMARDRRRAG